jgi:dodecin
MVVMVAFLPKEDIVWTRRSTGATNGHHEHRTAKIVELMGSSTKGFEDAIRHAILDAADSTRGISGAHIENLSVKCENGEILEYKVNLKVAFGVERTRKP